MAFVPRCHKKTFLTLIVGAIIGILFSPVSLWLHSHDTLQFVDIAGNPLCTRNVLAADTSAGVVSPEGTYQTLSSRSLINRTQSLSSSLPPANSSNLPVRILEVDRSVKPPRDPSVRYKELRSELAPRRLLFTGVVTAKKYLDTRALAINRTWGKEMKDLYFFSSHSDSPGVDLPIITLPGINDTQYPPQRKVYHMLKYMHDHFIDQYDFFMRADDDVYVKSDLLLELLQTVNPAQDIYMGCPGFGKPNDRSRIQLDQNEHYCMGGPGVIFSRSALRKLAPHLDACLSEVVVSYNEDVEVGRCVSKMVNIQCTWSWETSVLFWTDYKKILPTPQLYTDEIVKKALSLHPLKDPKLMYRVHQYIQERRLKRMMQQAAGLQSDIELVSSYLPVEMSHYGNHPWLWYDLGMNPKTRFEIATWEYFNSTRLFLPHEHMPVVGLPGNLKTGINTALEVLMDVMNAREGSTHAFQPPYHLFDGFSHTDPSSGIQYTLHMSVHRQSIVNPISYVANVFLPFQGAGMATYTESKETHSQVVHVIVSVPSYLDTSAFLVMYEGVVLKHNLKAHLHLVLFNNNEKTTKKISELTRSYPQGQLTIHQAPKQQSVSNSYAYDLVSGTLSNSDLMVFFDAGLLFTSEFLNHCRMNAVLGHQVYSPVLFSFYKPDLVSKYIQRPPQMLISADSGFFLRYNYQVTVIYKQDYEQMGGHGSVGNDDIKFVDKLVKTDLYFMRALEPYLRRNFKGRNCKGLSGSSHLACMTSRADTLGSKKILGSLIASHDLLDKL